MPKPTTLYATFAAEQQAEAAARALADQGLAPTDVSIIRPRRSHIGETGDGAGASLLDTSVPVSPADLPADLPIPDVGVIASPITAAIDLNAGTRIGEDASTTHNSPGYAYEGQDIEGQDALAQQTPHTHKLAASLNISLANVTDYEKVIALLKEHGATSTQLF